MNLVWSICRNQNGKTGLSAPNVVIRDIVIPKIAYFVNVIDANIFRLLPQGPFFINAKFPYRKPL
jgi:hypothetical protein